MTPEELEQCRQLEASLPRYDMRLRDWLVATTFMILTAQDRGELMFSQVRVEEVEKRRCRIKCEWKDSELVVGQIVSSRFHE